MESDPLQPRRPLTPEEELQAAKNYTTSVIHQTEEAAMGEMEKTEGRVPGPKEIKRHGRCRIDQRTGANQYFWRGKVIVTVTPGAIVNGVRGTKIETHGKVSPLKRRAA